MGVRRPRVNKGFAGGRALHEVGLLTRMQWKISSEKWTMKLISCRANRLLYMH